jgi:hypothetical protein
MKLEDIATTNSCQSPASVNYSGGLLDDLDFGVAGFRVPDDGLASSFFFRVTELSIGVTATIGLGLGFRG